MADRIIGMASAFSFALLSDRLFFIGRRKSLPNLEEVFTSPYVNWSRVQYEEDWILEPLQHKARVRNYNQSVLEQKLYYAVNTLDDWKLQDRFLRQNIRDILGNDYRETFIVLNRGKTIRIFENQNYANQLNGMGITPYTAFGCFVQFLLRPKPFIFSPLFEEFKQISQFTADADSTLTKALTPSTTLIIAIQIRAGDKFIINNQHTIDIAQYSAYFTCAKQIEQFALEALDSVTKKKFTETKWFLVSDSVPLRRAAVEKYGSDKIITELHSKIEHSSKETSVCNPNKGGNCNVSIDGFATAAAEWWLMSFARYHVISCYSGYGRAAAMMSLYPNSIFTIPDGKTASNDIVCNNRTYTDLETLSYDWSGI